MLRLPDLARLGEVGIAEGSSACLLGDPPRLLVLAPTGALHVVDPAASDGPVELAELTIAPGSELLAVSGTHALVTTPAGIVLVNAGDTPSFSRFPTRGGEVELAAAIRPDHFIVQIGGVLEEWSGPMRSPLRRFRLERPVSALFLGAGTRFIWFVVREAPSELVIVPLVGNAPPARIELPEPVHLAVADTAGLQLAIIGERSRGLWVASLATRAVTQVAASDTDSVAWRGDHELVRATASVVELVSVPKATGAEGVWTPTSSTPISASLDRPVSSVQQLAAWRDKVMRARAEDEPREPATSPVPGSGPVSPPGSRPSGPVDVPIAIPPRASEAGAEPSTTTLYQWRDALVAWTRATLRGTHGDPPLLAACPLHDIGLRLGLVDDSRYMLWLIYGARLCGFEGVAPADLVEVCPNRWDDALGRSAVTATGAFSWKRERVQLVPEVKAALDEIDPVLGTVIASAAALTLRIAVIAPPETDLVALARWAAPAVGAVFAPNDRGQRQPERFLLEARARGLAPVVPVSWFENRALPTIASLIVVDDEHTAERLQLEVAATWTPAPPAS